MRPAAALTLAALLPAAGPQDRPPAKADADVVVVGEAPRIEPGLWEVTRTAGRLRAFTGITRSSDLAVGATWRQCLRDAPFGTLAAMILHNGVAAQAVGCSALRVRVSRDRVYARQSCRSPQMLEDDRQSGGVFRLMGLGGAQMGAEEVVDASGRFAGDTIRLDVTDTKTVPGIGADQRDDTVSEITSRLLARRIGTCGAAPSASPTPTPAVVKAPPEELSPEPQAADLTSRVPDPVEGAPDDIVVVARKLLRLRLHYGSDARSMRWCHADVKSGDPRIDRIGCAILGACVKAGADDQSAALACFNRRVASVVPAVRPAR